MKSSTNKKKQSERELEVRPRRAATEKSTRRSARKFSGATSSAKSRTFVAALRSQLFAITSFLFPPAAPTRWKIRRDLVNLATIGKLRLATRSAGGVVSSKVAGKGGSNL